MDGVHRWGVLAAKEVRQSDYVSLKRVDGREILY